MYSVWLASAPCRLVLMVRAQAHLSMKEGGCQSSSQQAIASRSPRSYTANMLDRTFWAVFLCVAILGIAIWLTIFEHNYHPRIYRYSEEVTRSETAGF